MFKQKKRGQLSLGQDIRIQLDSDDAKIDKVQIIEIVKNNKKRVNLLLIC